MMLLSTVTYFLAPFVILVFLYIRLVQSQSLSSEVILPSLQDPPLSPSELEGINLRAPLSDLQVIFMYSCGEHLKQFNTVTI